MVLDLFDDSNKYYRAAVDNPLKIIEPLGRTFFRDKEIDNLKRSHQERGQLNDDDHAGYNRQYQGQNSDLSKWNNHGNFTNNKFPQDLQFSKKKKTAKKISAVLIEKDKLLEQITYNKVSQRQVDLRFLQEVKPDIPKAVVQLLSETEFKQAYQNFDRNLYIQDHSSIIDQIRQDTYENLKALKCQNLLKMLSGFVKKTSQVSTFYQVLGTIENISYLEYLKKEVEFALTTSILKVWLQQSGKYQQMRQSSGWSDLETYSQNTSDVDIMNGDSVKNYIEEVRKNCQNDDPMWDGFDLYLGLKSISATEGYAQQEKQSNYRLLFDIVVLCSLLAEQQNCILKFYSSFNSKTLMLLYLLFKVFQTTVMSKPRTSSLSSNSRYVLCIGLKVEPARKLAEILLAKYDSFIKEEVLPIDIRTMTQDQKFTMNFIEKFSRNLVKLQIDYFDSEEITNKKYSEIVKMELSNIFAQPFYRDLVDTFQIDDFKLKKELGINKQMNFIEAYQSLDNETQQANKENMILNALNASNGQIKQNDARFSDEEDDEEVKDQVTNSGKAGFLGEFIEFSKNKSVVEKQKYEERKKKGIFKQSPKDDSTIINQKNDRDLDFTRNLMKNIGIAPPPPSFPHSSIARSKKRK